VQPERIPSQQVGMKRSGRGVSVPAARQWGEEAKHNGPLQRLLCHKILEPAPSAPSNRRFFSPGGRKQKIPLSQASYLRSVGVGGISIRRILGTAMNYPTQSQRNSTREYFPRSWPRTAVPIGGCRRVRNLPQRENKNFQSGEDASDVLH
jgi:hypothetical protein